jgi:acetoin:2,6-dichlorophenolindophenol oxidoreductase subunit beta
MVTDGMIPQSTRRITYSAAINETLHHEMRRDERVIVLGEDIAGGAGKQDQGIIDAWGGPFGKTRGLIKEFGAARVRDCPISEMGFMGAAVGAAATGLRPVVDLMFVDFLGVCLDQLMNNAAFMRYMFGGKISLPLTVSTMVGAGTGSAGQHSKMLYPMLVHLPGLKVVVPSSAATAKGLYTSAIRDNDPVIVCDHKLLLGSRGEVSEESYSIPLGKADIPRSGNDISLIGMSRMTRVCLDAAAQLESDGIDAEVIDLLSLSPLDEEAILASARKTGRVVIVDEAFPRCNIGADIAALLADRAFDSLKAPVKRVSPPHVPVPFSPVLEKAFIPSADHVAETARAITRLPAVVRSA